MRGFTDTAFQLPLNFTDKLKENRNVLFVKTQDKIHCFQVLDAEL